MAKIQIDEFKGIMPKLANDKLPANMAQIAFDLKTASGALSAYMSSTPDVALDESSYKTFFEEFENGNRNWVQYDGAVFWSRSPVPDDSFERMYFAGDSGLPSRGTITFTDGMTDGETVTVGLQTFEFDIAEDGVGGGNTDIGDATTLTKEACAAALAAETPAAAVTLTDNFDGTVTVTATAHGTAGDAIVLTDVGGHIAVDGAGTLGATQAGQNDGEYRAFANDINSSPFDQEVDFYLPTAPIDMVAPTITNSTGGAVYRAYIYTYVSRYGEQSGPSLIAEKTTYTAGEAMEINSITPSTEDQYITAVGTAEPKMRFYRTATDGSGTADFLLVCEATWFADSVTYAVGDHVLYNDGGGLDLYRCTFAGVGTWAGGTHTFLAGELVLDADLQEALPTATWGSVPANVTNLRSHPNGFFVGSYGRVLHFSEPFQMHAWPEDYRITLDANIVGLGVFGSTIVVCTDANIYTFSGPHPDSLYKQRLAFQPCLSQRGVVETDLGVMFPTKEGFQLVAADSSPKNVTSNMFKPEDWADYELETIHGVWYNKSYYGWYKSEDFQGGIKIDFLNESITTSNEYHYASNVATGDGVFRTIFKSSITDPGTLYISKWDVDPTSYKNYQYKSPRYILSSVANFKVAQVILDTDFYDSVLEIIADGTELASLNQTAWDETDWGYQMGGPINDYMIGEQDMAGDDLYTLSDLGVQSYVDFNVYVDGALKFTKQISNSNIFKLPRGFKDKKWEFEVIGMIPVKRITVATSTEEIK